MAIRLLIILLGVGLAAQAQVPLPPDSAAVLRQARADIAVLCADSLAGRGYVLDGHTKAAEYLAKRLQHIGVYPLPAYGRFTEGFAPLAQAGAFEYYQEIAFTENLIESCQLEHALVNGIGHDLLPHPMSGPGEGQDNVVYLANEVGTEAQVAGKLVLIDQDVDTVLGLPEERKPEASLLRDPVQRAFWLDHLGAKGVIIANEARKPHAFAQQALEVPVFQWTASREARQQLDGQTVSYRLKAQEQAIESQNVLGILPGTNPEAPAIAFIAHYDHLGQIDSAIFAGANDNASGTAFVLSLAEYFVEQHIEHPLPHTLLFLFVSGEEAGLHGSSQYVEDPLYPLDNMGYVLDFDLLGYGENGMMCVACPESPDLAERLLETNAATDRPIALHTRPNRANSDHWPFTEAGIPAVFFYLEGGKPYYHDIFDRPEELSLAAYWQVFQLVTRHVMAEQRALSPAGQWHFPRD